jgi:ribonucleoside-triphosphate reductase
MIRYQNYRSYMNKSNKLLSDIVSFRTYAKHLPELNRRETLKETIDRNMHMHLDNFPKLSNEILESYKLVHQLKVMPSMRALQFSGPAIEDNNARQYNCAFVHIKYERVFAEILYLLLSGTGVGFSVQKHHINQLPKVQLPKERATYVIPDSIEGWAESLNQLMGAYFYGGIMPIFDYSQIRPKGSYLKTTGAKAPGATPLNIMHVAVQQKLQNAVGQRLASIEVHDIICMIADCVLAGGIRRAALISLFDKNDEEMLKCKHGEWWTDHPYRARANNSAIMLRHQTTQGEFNHVYDMCIESNAGEPGFIWTNDLELGVNPCAEISLNSNQFCNLTTINASSINGILDFAGRAIAASTIGTIQASYTKFPYLSSKWKEITEREALIGVSMTGIQDTTLNDTQISGMAKLVVDTNNEVAEKLGIGPAYRTTTIKPEGTSSCVLGTSSGIHARYAPHYLRRVRLNKMDSLTQYLMRAVPQLMEQDKFDMNGMILTVPQESNPNATFRENVSAHDMLLQVLRMNHAWVMPGHNQGINPHNVSCTIEYETYEINSLRDLMWAHRAGYAGISLLPRNNTSYTQPPFEECTKQVFDELNQHVSEIDLTQVTEVSDGTNRSELVACGGGSCELK